MAHATSASEFAELRDELAHRLREEQQNPSGRYQSVQAIEREVLKDSGNDVRKIFRTGESARDERGPTRGRQDSVPQGTWVKSPDEAFLWRVIGDPPEYSRAKLFTILLFLQVDPLSTLWRNFVNSLHLHQEGEPPSAFRDAKLPLSRRDISKLFGANNTNRFDEAQHQYYPVDIKPHFDEIMKKLRNAVAERKVECKDLEGHDEREPNDVFWPDTVAPSIVKEYKENITQLHEEAFKVKLTPPDQRDFEWNRKTYHELCKVKQDAATFYKGVQSCCKAFAILTQVVHSPDSEMWRQFETACLRHQQSPVGITDDQMPLDYDLLKSCFGDNDSDNWIFWNLQFSFCAPTLLEGEQVHYSTRDRPLHLPICERQLIKEGGGSQGAVYCVKLDPGHFRSERTAKYLVMKRAPFTRDNANEWVNLNSFFNQPTKHESILIPRASLVTKDQIYIFSDKADCNLDQYMEDDHINAKGPLNFKDRIRHLSSMVGVAGGLEYLHRQLVHEEFRKAIVMYHLDVKAANVLVTKQTNGRLLFQLTDFGISSMKQRPKDWKSGRDSLLIRAQTTQLRLGSGNPNTPPEAIENDQVDSKADVWAFGALLARFTAWLVKGKQTMMEFERSRGGREVDGVIEEKEFFIICSNTRQSNLKQPVLHEGVGRFFENLIRRNNGDTEREVKLFYESLWWILRKKLLVCDKGARADIREIPKILQQILESKQIDDFEQDAPPRTPSGDGSSTARAADTNELSNPPDVQGPSTSAVLELPYRRTTDAGRAGPNDARRYDPTTDDTDLNDSGLSDAEIDQTDFEIGQNNTEMNPTNQTEAIPDDLDTQDATATAVTDSEPDSGQTLTQTVRNQVFAQRPSIDSTRTAPETQTTRQRTRSANNTNLPPLSSPRTQPASPQPSTRGLWHWGRKSKQATATPSHSSRRAGSAPEQLVSAIRSGDRPAFNHALTHTLGTGLSQLVDGCTAIEHAFKHGQLDMAKELIDKGANKDVVHATRGTLLHRAAMSGNVEMARLLLEHGIDINVEDSSGITALAKICQLEQRPDHFQDMLQCLLGVRGVNVDARDDNYATPLIRAAKHGDEWAVETLLEAGARLCVYDNDGCNPLHGAIRSEGATITKALLVKDAESKLITMKDDQGRTALHACADLGSKQALENAKILVENGADANAEDYAGDTPLDLINGQSETPSHSKMAEFLIKRGGALVTEKIKNRRKEPFRVIQDHMNGQPRSPSTW
jgi:ankyrin repeat protein